MGAGQQLPGMNDHPQSVLKGERSGEVSRGMEEVAMQTGQLASGADNQVAVLEATRADAQLASASARETVDVTTAGSESVERANETMEALADASHEVRESIRTLSERSPVGWPKVE